MAAGSDAAREEHAPLGIVVMGVSGSGKSTLGAALAARLGCDFIEGDALHPPENVARMRAGRSGHYMPVSLLQSQITELEPRGLDERWLKLGDQARPEDNVIAAIAWLGVGGTTEGSPR